MRLLTCVLLASVLNSRLHAQSDDSTSRQTLSGIHGVYVLVETPDTSVSGYGLTKAAVQTVVEIRLREAGIPILSREQSLHAPGLPYLYVNLQIANRREVHLFTFHLVVQFIQAVHLDRNPSIFNIVATWESRPVMGSTGAEYAHTILDDVGDQINEFVNAYLDANPRR